MTQSSSISACNECHCSTGIEHHQIADGFQLEMGVKGARLYRNNATYVQVVDLSCGAAVHFLYGNITDFRAGKGAYGGNDPQFTRQTPEQAWSDFSQSETQPFCITNGQFFRDDAAAATELAFPVKAEGQFVSDGYAGETEYPEEKMMLEVWGSRAEITAFNLEQFRSSSAPNIMVSLREDADKGVNEKTGRTFVGVKDNNEDGVQETLLILTAKSETQIGAAEVLRKFGASQVMMLDGGGSSQLLCGGKTRVYSNRTLPQMIGISTASP